jgi:hypothetical protein
MARNATRSLLSLALALVLAIVVGAFSGWSDNPDRSAALAVAWREMAVAGVSARTEKELWKLHDEWAQRHPGFHSPQPSIPIAILKSNPYLMGIFSLGLLCLFRPSRAWIAGVFLPAAMLSYFVINLSQALGLILAVSVCLLASTLYAHRRQKFDP